MTAAKKMKVLLEMRPALDGFAGIPQECRLLFRALARHADVEVEGLMQTSLRFLSPGMRIASFRARARAIADARPWSSLFPPSPRLASWCARTCTTKSVA